MFNTVVYTNESFVLKAPPNSGKSVIAFLALIYNRPACYIAPTKAIL